MSAKPQTTTTFYQVIEDKRYQITLPQARVEKLMDRVDKMIENAQYDKALKTIEPFITNETDATPRNAPMMDPTERKQRINQILEENKDLGEGAMIKRLRDEFGMSYPNARYYVKKTPKQ